MINIVLIGIIVTIIILIILLLFIVNRSPVTQEIATVDPYIDLKKNCTGYWYDSQNKCLPCPTTSVQNGRGIPTGLGKCNCIEVNDYWDGVNEQCKSCPSGSSVGSGIGVNTGTNLCKCIDPNMYWHSVNTRCEPCPSNSSVTGTGPDTYLTTNNGNCKCINNNFYWDPVTWSCANCPNNSSYNGQGQRVTGYGCRCNSINMTWNGYACI